MPNRIDSPIRQAARLAAWVLRDIGRELRVARILAGLTQVEVARRLGKSGSCISRVEHGLVPGINMIELFRHAAIVGLKPYLKLFPLGRRVMDGPQLALWERFRIRLADAWQVALEVAVPLPGDLRAADAVISIPGCRCMVEVITRLADFQAQYRAATVKSRDLGVDFIIFVLADTATNRRILREAGVAATDAFPLRTSEALRALGAGVSPGANAIILL